MVLSLKRRWFYVAIFLVTCIVCIQVLFVINKPWVSDYWEHKAVFLELYRHPVNPDHAVVNIKSQHPFFSPYVVAFAYAGRLLSINPNSLFDFISLFNLLFFLCSVALLERLVVKGKNQPKSFVLLLLTILFLWGVFPPYFSSFYHFVTLFFTSAYPATFAFCLAVVSGFLHNKLVNGKYSRGKQIVAFLGCIVLNWALLLIHPLTFLFCFSLYIYNYFQLFQTNGKIVVVWKSILYKSIALICFFVLPVLLAPLWTYYSLWDLFLERSFYGRFHEDSKVLYNELLLSYYALIIPFIMIVYSVIRKERQTYAFLIIITVLLLVFLLGYISGSFGYGRSISYIAVWIQMWAVAFLQKESCHLYRRRLIVLLSLAAIPFIYVSVKSVTDAAFTTHNDYVSRKAGKNFIATASIPEITHRLFFIKNHIEDGATVMTDLVTSRYVAAFNGKAIASPYSEYWVGDNEIRMTDLNIFFTNKDSAVRIKLLYKYKPNYLLLNPDADYIMGTIPSEMIKKKVTSENGYILIPLSF